MLTAKQKELRATRVGCSELFDAIDDPYGLWHRKVTGASKFTGDEDFIRMGNYFEEPVANDYVYRLSQMGIGARLYQPMDDDGEPVTFISESTPWLIGTPDFIPAFDVAPMPQNIGTLADLRKLIDSGRVDRILEIKTGAAMAERLSGEEDQWGSGGSASMVWLARLLDGHCVDPVSTARSIMAECSLQAHSGFQYGFGGVDEWGDPAECQMPRRYILQCLGYMYITGVKRCDLHRLRFGWGNIETYTYTVRWDEELFSGVLERVGKFVKDYLEPQKPPPRTTPSQVKLECLRVAPSDDRNIKEANSKQSALIGAYKKACIDLKRAEVAKEYAESLIISEIGASKGLKSGPVDKVSYGHRRGRKSVSAKKAVEHMVSQLSGLVGDKELIEASASALEAATSRGDDYRAISRPQKWTSGIESKVLDMLSSTKEEV